MLFSTFSDGYGTRQHPFVMPDPVLPPGWQIVRRERTDDGEHIWHLCDSIGRLCRWLEDEGGLEWVYRQRLAHTVSLSVSEHPQEYR